jgi:hypothetical protein
VGAHERSDLKSFQLDAACRRARSLKHLERGFDLLGSVVRLHFPRHHGDEFLKLDLAIIVLVDLSNHEIDFLLRGVDRERIEQLLQLNLGNRTASVLVDDCKSCRSV